MGVSALLFVSGGAFSAAAQPARPLITGVSHIAVYSANPVKSERFYVHDLGAVREADAEHSRGVRYYFSSSQWVEVLLLPEGSASINRLDHVAFATTNTEQLRSYLLAQGVAVPDPVQHGADGSQWIDVTDPEGNRIELWEPKSK